MAYEVKILNSAKKEIEEADNYYAGISHSLSDKFLEELKLTLGYLEINPYFQKRYNYWAVPFSNFPYLLFYKIDEKEELVQIFSCFHTCQNPKKYPK